MKRFCPARRPGFPDHPPLSPWEGGRKTSRARSWIAFCATRAGRSKSGFTIQV